MRGPVIAIDGPAGAGKSTVSRALARRLGLRYVDTGAMYRVVGLMASRQGLDLEDTGALAELCDAVEIRFEDVDGELRVWADDCDVTEEIRSGAAGQQASRISAVAVVRERLVARQRAMGREGGVVMEGRDIGTVVFPDADVKVFLTASLEERARRRWADLRARGEQVSLADVREEIARRDARDQGRAHSPLRPAPGAVVVDTTGVAVEEVVRRIAQLVPKQGSLETEEERR